MSEDTATNVEVFMVCRILLNGISYREYSKQWYGPLPRVGDHVEINMYNDRAYTTHIRNVTFDLTNNVVYVQLDSDVVTTPEDENEVRSALEGQGWVHDVSVESSDKNIGILVTRVEQDNFSNYVTYFVDERNNTEYIAGFPYRASRGVGFRVLPYPGENAVSALYRYRATWVTDIDRNPLQ